MTSRHQPSFYILTKGGANFPSSRFRAFQYLPLFEEDGFDVHIGKPPSGLHRRLRLYGQHRHRDVLLVQKRFISPPEKWLLRRIFKVILYDFDDAMGVPSSFKEENAGRLRRRKRQLQSMCRWADEVICCNETLRDLSGRSDAHLLPTPYTGGEEKEARLKAMEDIRLLWIGMDMSKLRPWENALGDLARHERVQIFISSHREEAPRFPFPFTYRKWSRDVEAELLDHCNLGIMPLPDDLNSRGKCALKIIQYMAHGLVPVASDVGFNREVIDHGANGFLCKESEELTDIVEAMLNGKMDTDSLQQAAYRRANEFSARELYPRLLSILMNAWEKHR